MACPPVRGDNPRALSEWTILRTGEKSKYNFFYTTYISVDLAHHVILRAKVGKGGIN